MHSFPCLGAHTFTYLLPTLRSEACLDHLITPSPSGIAVHTHNVMAAPPPAATAAPLDWSPLFEDLSAAPGPALAARLRSFSDAIVAALNDAAAPSGRQGGAAPSLESPTTHRALGLGQLAERIASGAAASGSRRGGSYDEALALELERLALLVRHSPVGVALALVAGGLVEAALDVQRR